MSTPFHTVKKFVQNLGVVEQGQVVASTVVVVSMATIISAMLATGQSPRLMDFISILTVGTLGFTGVYFSLRYFRQLDEQRRQLLALNTIADAVNRSVELEYVLQTALQRVTELLNIHFGWIYMLEGNLLECKSSKGTGGDFLRLNTSLDDPPSAWLELPRVHRERLHENAGAISPGLKELGIQFWTSIPLKAKDAVAGTLIVAGKDYDLLTPKQEGLLEAFGNQISVALTNAQLFDRVKRSEHKYIDLFENAPDIYLSINREHIIVGCNRTGATILGYPPQEIVGRRFESFFTSDREVAVGELLSQMFAAGQAMTNMEEQIVTREGRHIYVSLNSSMVFDEKGTTVNARIVARDISERKKMEAAILHAQKIDSIGSLAGGIAHDFNNILAAILGSASIMRRRVTERGRLYKYVEIIEAAARRGSSLTRQLLTFARKTDTDIKLVDINAIIRETVHLFESSISKDIIVKAELTSEATNVKGDEGQIQQALLNLLLNARDAMPEGGTVTVATTVTTADAHTSNFFSSVKPGAFVAIRVSDTGVGIDRSVQSRIFEPFFTTKDHGTGLGLSVLYGVVQNHAGFVNLESEVGHGTTFTVYLPQTTTKAHAAARHRRQRVPRGTESILVIDDEVSVAEIARDMLNDLGYSVTTVYDGKTGVETYRTRQASFDLVLLDMNMPLMGGREAFERLRDINPNLRIIILTGYGKGVLERPTFTSEINEFLQKPFQLEDLATKVRHVLDLQSVESELAT